MSTNISERDSRKQQLEELKNFTDAVNEEIANIVETLGWTMKSTMANIVSMILNCYYKDAILLLNCYTVPYIGHGIFHMSI